MTSPISQLMKAEGWMYLAVVIDLHSRAIIGWSMHKRMTKKLVCDALMMALFKRKFPEGVIVHSDRVLTAEANIAQSVIDTLLDLTR